MGVFALGIKDPSDVTIQCLHNPDPRQRAEREGHCFQHVHAITVAVDQYAEKALGNRDYISTSRTALVSFAATTGRDYRYWSVSGLSGLV
jgi:hypothetical protein